MNELEAARRALAHDETIDIITIGAKTGKRRTTEIWFRTVAGQIIICGTPTASEGMGVVKRRDWLANLAANPEFDFYFKQSVSLSVPAIGTLVRNPDERHRIMTAPETRWYRNQGFTIDDLVESSPIITVRFRGKFEQLNEKI
jgi:hypothetical protein